jgi:hypothetical protein
MDVHITDTFTKSIKRLMWHQSKVYRFYALFRYDIPQFIGNIWKFRKELWSHRWWDYRFTLEMLYRSIQIIEKEMSLKGIEVSETREPKIQSMRRALELLKHKLDDDYIDRAEAEVGELIMHDWEFEPVENGNMRLVDKETEEEKTHNRLVFEVARELEEVEWKELWDIFKGTKFSKKYGKKYDGTDMRGWWD